MTEETEIEIARAALWVLIAVLAVATVKVWSEVVVMFFR